MRTGSYNDNGGGYAAADFDDAPRGVRGSHLQPQRSLTRSLPRRPSGPPLTLETSTTPQPAHTAGRPTPAPLNRGANHTRPNYKITITESLRFQGIAKLKLRMGS